MSDSELLDWLSTNHNAVRPGVTKYGKPCWEWSGNGEYYAQAFTLRSAIAAAMLCERS